MPAHTRTLSLEAGLGAAGLFVASSVLAYGCLLMPRAAGHLSPIWLPNAVILAVLLLSPRRAWSTRLVAGVAGILAGHLAAGSPLVRAAGLTMLNGIEVVLAARLVLWRFGGRPDISQAQTSIQYGLLAAIPAAVGAATASIFLRWVYGVPITDTLVIWGLSDFAGLITVTPSIIALATEWRPRQRLDPWRFWPLLLLATVSMAVFWGTRFSYSYLVAAALMLVSYRLQLAGAAAGLFIALFAAVTGTLWHHGPFVSSQTSLTEQILSLQLFIAVSFHLSVPVALYRQRSQDMQNRLNRALLEARTAEAQYRQITEAVQDLIVQTDPDGRFVYVSPSVRTLGYEPENLIGRSVFTLAHPDERKRMRRTRNGFFGGGGNPAAGATFRLRIRTRDGDYRLFQSRPFMIRNEAGEAIALESVLRDVTEAVAAEEALKASEARYRLLSENMSDIVTRYGRDGVIRYVSPSVEGLLGYSPDELVGLEIGLLLPPEDRERVGAQFEAREEMQANAESFKVEFRLVRKDGSIAWLEAHPRPIYDPDTGEFIEWQDVVREIGERKALEAELTAAKVAAEAAADAKSEFLANMSHELRTPLTGVLGFTKLASSAEGLAEPARTYVQRVDEASKALLALVSDILDYSKLEAGDVRFRLRPTDLSELARASLRLFEAQADAKGIYLEVVDKLPPGLLELDADRMRQVLLNLIGNAVKFTDSGAVTVRLGFNHASGMLSVSVSDTGPGIAKERLPELFKRFSQVHDGSRRYGGTGLGLAICRGILEAQGGAISASSKLGEGSCFHFKLPTRVAAAREEETPPGQRRKIAVMVADDHPDPQKLIPLFLKDVADVAVASDGRTAVRMAGGRAFDVIMLDVRMPGLGGPQALQRIRAGSGPNRTTPAIALTADGGVEAADRLRAQGFAAAIPKPFSPVELISAIVGVLTPNTDSAPDDRSETSLVA